MSKNLTCPCGGELDERAVKIYDDSKRIKPEKFMFRCKVCGDYFDEDFLKKMGNEKKVKYRVYGKRPEGSYDPEYEISIYAYITDDYGVALADNNAYKVVMIKPDGSEWVVRNLSR